MVAVHSLDGKYLPIHEIMGDSFSKLTAVADLAKFPGGASHVTQPYDTGACFYKKKIIKRKHMVYGIELS